MHVATKTFTMNDLSLPVNTTSTRKDNQLQIQPRKDADDYYSVKIVKISNISTLTSMVEHWRWPGGTYEVLSV